MRILITGGTGFVGRTLIEHLLQTPSFEVRTVSRNPERARKSLPPSVEVFSWNPEKEPLPPEATESVDAIIHLAGENIADGRWTEERKKRIRDSRVLGTRHLVQGIQAMPTPPILLSTSAVGLYGDQGEQRLSEDSQPGHGFLADVCQEWEAEAVKAHVRRLAIFRLGVVIGPKGGMLQKVLPIFRAGLGGPLGNGQQWMSWIALNDLIQLLAQGLQDDRFEGVFNATSPNPVRNTEFTRALGKKIQRPAIMPVPDFGLKLAFGQMAEEALLASQRAVPERLLHLKFDFKHPSIESALDQAIP
jgi:uncharacterized protein (TIGR01777 family)